MKIQRTKKETLMPDSMNTSELTPDGRVGAEEKVENVDTSIGGTDVAKIAAEEPKAECHPPTPVVINDQSLVGKTVIYYTKVPDQVLLGLGIGPSTPIAVHVVKEYQNSGKTVVDLESVLRLVGDETFKVYGVEPGKGLGQYEV